MKQYSTLDMQGNKIINCPSLGEGGGDASLLEEITSNVAVGGAPSGTKFDVNTTFTEFAKKLLRTDILPTISFSASGYGLHELGTTVNRSTLTFSITNLLSVTVPISNVQFKLGNTVLDTQTFVKGQSTYSFVYGQQISENTTFSAVLTYNGSKTSSASSTIKFVAPSYVGAVNSLTPSESEILSLTKLVKDSKGYTLNGATLSNQRFCYAYPQNQGNLTSIKDANNFEYLSSYTKSTFVIDGITYNLYILTDPVTITGAKQIYA